MRILSTILLLACACGASGGDVTVTVLDPDGTDAVVPGAHVIFAERDGTIVADVVTGADGKAVATLHDGGSITAYVPEANPFANPQEGFLVTIMDVHPGDDLLTGTPLSPTPAGTFTVNFPEVPGAARYDVANGCSLATGATSPVVMPVYRQCPASTDLVVTARDASFQIIGALEADDVPFTGGGTATLTGPYPGLQTMNLALDNVPARTFANWSRRYLSFSVDAPMQGFDTPQAHAELSVAGNPITNKASIWFVMYESSPHLARRINLPIDGTATSARLDLGTGMLPWVSAPTLDMSTGGVAIETTPLGTNPASPDLVSIGLFYRRENAQVPEDFRWSILAPKSESFRLPALPAELSGASPRAGDILFESLAFLLDWQDVSSWDEVRAQFLSAHPRPFLDQRIGYQESTSN